MIVLRPHQQEAIKALLDAPPWFRERNAEVTVAGGKSLILAGVAMQLRGRVLVLAHTEELVKQNAKAFRQLGGTPAFCAARVGVNLFARVTFGTIQTVARRIPYFSDVSDILIDEVHRLPDEEESQYQKLIAANARATIYGVSGTMFREGKGEMPNVVYRYGFAQALEDGFVKPLRSVPASAPDIETKGLKTNADGEWTGSELTTRAVKLAEPHARAALEALYEEQRIRTIVFACDIEHCDALEKAYYAAGETSARAVHSKTPPGLADDYIKAFRSGTLRRLLSVAKFSTGFDVPDIDSVVLNRPIKSRVLYAQSLGRGARLTPYAVDAIVIDFGGNIERHGPLDMVQPPRPKKKKESENDTPREPTGLLTVLRGVGNDLQSEAVAAAALRAEVRHAPRWVKVIGEPSFVWKSKYWTIPTGIGPAKWFSAAHPGPLTNVYVQYHSRYGLEAKGGTDPGGVLIKAV